MSGGILADRRSYTPAMPAAYLRINLDGNDLYIGEEIGAVNAVHT